MKKREPTQEKVKSLDDLARSVATLKRKGKKIVHCHGVFDLMHPGHIRHLEAAKRLGDLLVVTVTQDRHVNKGPGRPVFNQRLRADSLAALQCVDFVAVNEWPTAVEAIRKLKPDIYVKGSDYADPAKDLTGKIRDEAEAVREVGGELQFTDEIAFSSTNLLNAFFEVYPEQTMRFIKDFRARYSAPDVIRLLESIRKLNILVIGDAIVDEYQYCQDMGKASKDAMLTTRFMSSELFAGGILAVANHVAGFCENVHLLTCLGKQNSLEDFIRGKLRRNIRARFFHREDAGTTLKRRFVTHDYLTKMFEVCYLNDRRIPPDVEAFICDELQANIGSYDLVMVADFGHGLTTPRMLEILKTAKFLAVNAQTNSANLGFNLITRYPRADYICINEPEIRYATHDRHGKLEDLTAEIVKKLRCGRVVTTCGPLGCLVYTKEGGYSQIPPFSKRVVDRIGASDSFFAVTAPCAAAGIDMDLAGFIGNAVAALKVGIVANRSPVEPVHLFKFINALLT